MTHRHSRLSISAHVISHLCSYTLPGLLAVAIVAGGWISRVQAGDDQETLGPAGQIFDRRWASPSFPLQWRLHSAGVVNNSNNVASTPAITNDQARSELTAAFNAWQGVGNAAISFADAGATATGTTGFDQINVVTWSDPSDFATAPGTIARGITTRYSGPTLILSDANRILTIDGQTQTLDPAVFPNGFALQTGTILDMDLSFNSANFDFEIVPASIASVADIRAVATHEIGHMLGLAHTSIKGVFATRPTMFPVVSSGSAVSETEARTLELDDRVAAGTTYPGPGFFPGGLAPFVTGAISGTVTQADGTPVPGIRVWVFQASSPANPVVERYTATDHDGNGAAAGTYIVPGLPPGDYFVAVQPWLNGVPDANADNPASNQFNRTATVGAGVALFNSEAFDDFVSAGSGSPDLRGARRVRVTAGQTTREIDFALGVQQADIVLLMDRSGSMAGPSGAPGVNKLQALQTAANEFVDLLSLDAGNRLGLVAFAETVIPLNPTFDLQLLTAASKLQAQAAINGLVTGGFTNIIQGVETGLNQLGAIGAPNSRQVMVVFSDGKHNRPIGTSVLAVKPAVLDNDARFHSIGFGSDVSEAELSDIAAATGGSHVNEQDLSPLDLQKHFITVATSAVDAALLLDPRHQLSAGQRAAESTAITAGDKYLTFVVDWLGKDPKTDVQVTVTGSDGKCVVPSTPEGPGHRRIRSNNYEIVRVLLPYRCPGTGRHLHEGIWSVSALTSHDATVDILVLGRSNTNLFLRPLNPGASEVRAVLAREGRRVSGAKLHVEFYSYESQGRASAEEDRGSFHAQPIPVRIRKPAAIKTMELVQRQDKGRNTPEEYRLKLTDLPPGFYHCRIIAEFPLKDGVGRREANTSASIGKGP